MSGDGGRSSPLLGWWRRGLIAQCGWSCWALVATAGWALVALRGWVWCCLWVLGVVRGVVGGHPRGWSCWALVAIAGWALGVVHGMVGGRFSLVGARACFCVGGALVAWVMALWWWFWGRW